MKITFNILAAAAVMAAIFTSCDGGKKELSFWIGGAPEEIAWWEETTRSFEQDTGIPVRFVRQPTYSDQRLQGLMISLESKQPDPDVFLMDVIWISRFARSGWLEPLDPLARNDDFTTEVFFQNVLDQSDRFGGTLYALPVFIDVGLLYYRKDLLGKYGYRSPPRTWNELTEMSRTIIGKEGDPNITGFVWQGAQYEGLVCTFLEFITSHNGTLYDGETLVPERDGNRKGLEFMRDLIHESGISPDNTYTEMKEEEVRRAFQRGSALFERNWLYAWNLHQKEGSPVRGRVAMAPLPRAPEGKAASALGGWHVGLSRYSDRKEDAWKLVKYILSQKTQSDMVLKVGWHPGRSDIYGLEKVTRELPHGELVREIFSAAVNRPALPYYTQVSQIVQLHVNNCLMGKISPERALENIRKEYRGTIRVYEE